MTVKTRTNPKRRIAARRIVGKDGPDPVDIYVGRRLKERRLALGLSQGKLAAPLGLTFQQLQKYERGANRISASKLFLLANILKVPVSYFFDDMPAIVFKSASGGKTEIMAAAVRAAERMDADPVTRRTVRLMAAMDPRQRQGVCNVAKAIRAAMPPTRHNEGGGGDAAKGRRL